MLGLHCFVCHYSLTPSDTLDAIFHLNLNHTFSALYILLTLWYFSLLMFRFYLQQDMRNLMYSFILLHWVENGSWCFARQFVSFTAHRCRLNLIL